MMVIYLEDIWFICLFVYLFLLPFFFFFSSSFFKKMAYICIQYVL